MAKGGGQETEIINTERPCRTLCTSMLGGLDTDTRMHYDVELVF